MMHDDTESAAGREHITAIGTGRRHMLERVSMRIADDQHEAYYIHQSLDGASGNLRGRHRRDCKQCPCACMAGYFVAAISG